MSVCTGLDDGSVRPDPEITDSIDQFPIKCSSKSNFDSCVNITEDELGAGSVEIVLENGVVTSIRTVPFPYRLLSENFMVKSSRPASPKKESWTSLPGQMRSNKIPIPMT